MIRRGRPTGHTGRLTTRCTEIGALRAQLFSRRQFLIAGAGGSLALLFGIEAAGAQPPTDPWPTLDAVLQHLLPSESDSPGAVEINALAYLRFVVDDPKVDRETREFILQGVTWLEELAQQHDPGGFVALDAAQREQLLRRIAGSDAGENWIATLLTYLLEALLTAPAYGGNPDGIGWRWLEYVPGFPLPGSGTRYMELPL